MGNTATKFRKALVNGDDVLACHLYESNPQFKEALDPNSTYGESYQHNTPLHYASRHAMARLLRSGSGSSKQTQITWTFRGASLWIGCCQWRKQLISLRDVALILLCSRFSICCCLFIQYIIICHSFAAPLMILSVL